MSYVKAMKHWHNIRKCRKMQNTIFLCTTHELTPEKVREIKAYQRKMQGK